jgi:hypothetical protein
MLDNKIDRKVLLDGSHVLSFTTTIFLWHTPAPRTAFEDKSNIVLFFEMNILVNLTLPLMVSHLWVFSGKGHADADIFCYHLKTETSDVACCLLEVSTFKSSTFCPCTLLSTKMIPPFSFIY